MARIKQKPPHGPACLLIQDNTKQENSKEGRSKMYMGQRELGMKD